MSAWLGGPAVAHLTNLPFLLARVCAVGVKLQIPTEPPEIPAGTHDFNGAGRQEEGMEIWRLERFTFVKKMNIAKADDDPPNCGQVPP